MLTEHTLDTGTVSINYAEGPKSGPTLVLVHGITAHWRLFRPIVPTLAQRWHLVAMDLRGPGGAGLRSHPLNLIRLAPAKGGVPA